MLNKSITQRRRFTNYSHPANGLSRFAVCVFASLTRLVWSSFVLLKKHHDCTVSRHAQQHLSHAMSMQTTKRNRFVYILTIFTIILFVFFVVVSTAHSKRPVIREYFIHFWDDHNIWTTCSQLFFFRNHHLLQICTIKMWNICTIAYFFECGRRSIICNV